MFHSKHARLAVAVVGVATTLGVTLWAQTSQPPQTRRVVVNGADLTYTEQGAGPPVVFVHGAVGDLRFWEPQRDAFAKRHRFVAYTFRYHGTAPWPDDGKQYSDETHAADLASFISALKAGPVHLVGLSYGGKLAAMVATRQPHLVQSLTLAEPSLFALLADQPEGKPVLEAWGKQFQPIAAAVKAGDLVGATKFLAAVVTGEPVEKFDKLPQGLRQILLDNARTLGALFANPEATVPCESLRALKIPTLVIRGERTPQIFVKTNEAVTRCVAGSRSVVITNASHAMSYDNPAAFNQAVLAFLEKR